MMNAVIIDDELNGIKSLELLLSKYCPDVKVVASGSSPQKGIEIIHDYRPEIVFLDIHMPVMNGFDLLEKLNYRDFYLIFTTAYREYALKALKMNAFDYLLKPIDFEELKQAVEKIKLKKSKNFKLDEILHVVQESLQVQTQKVLLPSKTGIENVNADEIMYIEAQSNQTKVSLVNKVVHVTYKTLKDYEEQLHKGPHFFRIQHSFIINLQHIKRYSKEDGGYVFMKDEKKISISKSQKKEFLRLFQLDKK